MTVAKIPALLDTTAAVSSVGEQCISTGRLASELITDTELENLSPSAFRELARIGWISEVNDWLHRARGKTIPLSAEIPPVRPGVHPIMGRNPRGAWRPLDIRLRGADEALKRLGDFDLSDIEYLRNECAAQEIGWSRKRQWAERAAELLRKSKKAKIDQLPISQVEELSRMAKEAWS